MGEIGRQRDWQSGLPALFAGVALGKKVQGKSERQGKVKKGPGHDGSP